MPRLNSTAAKGCNLPTPEMHHHTVILPAQRFAAQLCDYQYNYSCIRKVKCKRDLCNPFFYFSGIKVEPDVGLGFRTSTQPDIVVNGYIQTCDFLYPSKPYALIVFAKSLWYVMILSTGCYKIIGEDGTFFHPLSVACKVMYAVARATC